MLSNVYSKSYIHASPQMATLAKEILYNRLLPQIAQSADAKVSIDAYSIINATAMDFMTGYLFGLANGTNFLKNEEFRREWINRYQSRKKYFFWFGEFPTLQQFLNKVGVRVIPIWVDDTNKDIEAFNMEKCDAANEIVEKGSQSEVDISEEPVVFKQMKTAMEKEKGKTDRPHEPGDQDQQRKEIASEMLDHLGMQSLPPHNITASL